MATPRKLLILAAAATGAIGAARYLRRPPAQRRMMRATEQFFGTLSRTRGTRIFHPLGGAWAGTFTVADDLPGRLGTPLFTPGARRHATVRYSRGVGLPEPLPDFLGVAVRLEHDDERQDLLFTTAVAITPTVNLLVPARRLQGHHLSYVLPVRVSEERCVPGCVQQAGEDGSRPVLHLTAAIPGGETLPLGTIRLERELPEEESRRLAFNPWNTSSGVVPVGLINRLRLPAYKGSQEGRAESTQTANAATGRQPVA